MCMKKSKNGKLHSIINDKYSKADPKTITESSTNLDPQEINEQYTLLNNYNCWLDGNPDKWHGKTYDIKLKPDAEPYHETPFTVPRIHELTLKKELDQLKALRS